MRFVRAKWTLVTFFLSIATLSFYWSALVSWWSSLNAFSAPFGKVYLGFGSNTIPDVEVLPWDCPQTICKCPESKGKGADIARLWNASSLLMGSPAKGFKDNLLPEKYYVTSWAVGGLRNSSWVL
ncbi:hypothetical protein BDQ17DRAFT_109628 [Cyathus striatus]|nr:hypothetical protein BDQ17DRAFT_109628 [Cyathus striatus]